MIYNNFELIWFLINGVIKCNEVYQNYMMRHQLADVQFSEKLEHALLIAGIMCQNMCDNPCRCL